MPNAQTKRRKEKKIGPRIKTKEAYLYILFRDPPHNRFIRSFKHPSCHFHCQRSIHDARLPQLSQLHLIQHIFHDHSRQSPHPVNSEPQAPSMDP